MTDQKTFRLAVVPGDGIGPEVTTEALKVLDAVAAQHGVTFERTEYDLGAKRWHATGQPMDEGEYDHGTKVGLWRRYHPDGSARDEKTHGPRPQQD